MHKLVDLRSPDCNFNTCACAMVIIVVVKRSPILTDRQTDKSTDRQNDYSTPCCARAHGVIIATCTNYYGNFHFLISISPFPVPGFRPTPCLNIRARDYYLLTGQRSSELSNGSKIYGRIATNCLSEYIAEDQTTINGEVVCFE